MSFQDVATWLVRRMPQRRLPPPATRAAVVSITEFDDPEEGRVWQIQRADGTTEVHVAADTSQWR